MPKPLRVLIVEDSEDDALLILHELERGGYSPVSTRVDTHPAMAAALREGVWDIVISDYSLPHFSGTEALKLVRESGRYLPFIMVSGTVGEDVAVELMKAGADDYIMKSSLKRLAPAVKREIDDALERQKRWEAEEAMRKSEEKLRLIFESVTDGIVVIDLSGKIVECNESTLTMYGCTGKQELLGRNVFEFIAKSDYMRASQNMTRTLAYGFVKNVEYMCLGKDGREFPIELSAALLKDSARQAVGFVGVIQDISERKRAEDLLRKSEARFRTVVMNAPIGIATSDTDRRFVTANAAFCSVLRYTESELQKLTFKDVIHPEDLKESLANMAELDRGIISSFTQEKRYIRKDGQEIIGKVVLSAVRDQEGKIQLYIAELEDITAHKKAEETLRRSEEKLRLMFECMSDGVTVLDLDRHIVQVNNARVRMHGYEDKDELIGRNILDLIAEKDRLRVMESTEKLLIETVSHSNEYSMATKDGREFPAEVNSAILRDGSGQPIGYIAISRDITRRKRAEESLRKSEEKYVKLVENSNDGIIIMQGGVLRFANPKATELAGFPSEVILGKPFIDFVAPECRELVAERYRRRMSGEAVPGRYEIEILSKGGRVTVEISASLVEYEGAPADMAMVRDITERKKAENALKRREEFDRVTSIISSRFVGITDMDNTITASLADIGELSKASRAYLFLFNPDETTIDNTHEWCAEGVSPQIQNLKNVPCSIFPWWFARLRKGEVILIPDVSRMPAEASAEKEILESQDVKSLLVIPVYSGVELAGFIGFDNIVDMGEWNGEDITLLRISAETIGNALARKQAEDMLRVSEKRYRSYVEVAAGLGWITNADGEVVEDVPSFRQYTGQSYEQVKGAGWSNAVHPEDRENVRQVWQKAVREKTNYEAEYRLRRHDGDYRYFLARGIPVLTEDGSAHEWVGVCIDITERKKMEEALKQTVDELQAFAYTAAHDLQAPLVTVQGFAAMLRTDLEKNETERLKEDIRLIDTGVSKMQRLLKSVLEYGRTGRLPQPTKEIPFREIVEESIQQVIGHISSHGVIVSVAEDFPSVFADRVSMAQVLNNLIVNALDYRDKTRPLTIEIGHRKLESQTVYFVRDNGIGISPDQVGKVFELFYRGASESPGTGLGLTIVKRIIEGHGGKAWIESEVGKGTTVCFTLAKS